MRVFIRDMLKNVSINIYGTDGNEHTKDFFGKYLRKTGGVHEALDDEKELYNTDSEWIIDTEEDFRSLVGDIKRIQEGIDEVQTRLIEGDSLDEYTYSGECYVI